MRELDDIFKEAFQAFRLDDLEGPDLARQYSLQHVMFRLFYMDFSHELLPDPKEYIKLFWRFYWEIKVPAEFNIKTLRY